MRTGTIVVVVAAVVALFGVTCTDAEMVLNAHARLRALRHKRVRTHADAGVDVGVGAKYQYLDASNYEAWRTFIARNGWVWGTGTVEHLRDLYGRFIQTVDSKATVPEVPRSLKASYIPNTSNTAARGRVEHCEFTPILERESKTTGGEYVHGVLATLLNLPEWKGMAEAKYHSGHIIAHQLGGSEPFITQNPLNFFPQGGASNSGIYLHLENVIKEVLDLCNAGPDSLIITPTGRGAQSRRDSAAEAAGAVKQEIKQSLARASAHDLVCTIQCVVYLHYRDVWTAGTATNPQTNGYIPYRGVYSLRPSRGFWLYACEAIHGALRDTHTHNFPTRLMRLVYLFAAEIGRAALDIPFETDVKESKAWERSSGLASDGSGDTRLFEYFTQRWKTSDFARAICPAPTLQ